MPINVTDPRSNPYDQIKHAAEVLGRSKDRKKVFSAIYYGKQKMKSVSEIVKITKLSRIRILQEGKKLTDNHLVSPNKCNGETAYEKDSFYKANKQRILSLAANRKKLATFPSKATPSVIGSKVVIIRVPATRVQVKQITIDDIDSFSKARKINGNGMTCRPMLESKFKQGIKRILKEKGNFQDWGGEHNDLFTSRLKIKGKRIVAAFAFKGRGTRKKLTPAAMGKNGDQIQRLFASPAQVFLVQYWGQIDQSISDQMNQFAMAKSVSEAKKIYFGIIDGQDTNRILVAYKKHFGG